MDRKRQHEFIVSSVYRNIQHYQEMVQQNTNPELKKYYANLLNREILWLDYLQTEYSQSENGGTQTNTNVLNNLDLISNLPLVTEPITIEPITTSATTNPSTNAEPATTTPITTTPITTVPTTTGPTTNESSKKVFTLEELSQYDGSNGKPAYVAVNGIVYDVSLQPAWGGGTHFSISAGKDLTIEFDRCHSGVVTPLNRLPQVGVMDTKKEEVNP